MMLKSQGSMVLAGAVVLFAASGASADQAYPRVALLTPAVLQDDSAFQSFLGQIGSAIEAEGADALQAMAAPDFQCFNWTGEACATGRLADEMMGSYGSWDTLKAAWTMPPVTAAERSGEVCAPGEYDYDDAAAETAHGLVGDGNVDVAVEWLAAVGEVPVFGSPQAVEQIAVLENELVYPSYYADIEDDAGRMARQQVILPDGRRGFVRDRELVSLLQDSLCFAKGAAGWEISRFHRAYVP